MSELLNQTQFKLSNGLIIDLDFNWEQQKKTLGKNISHSTSSFGRGYPELILYADRYDTNEWEFLEKDSKNSKYHVIDYEYDLSKVRTIKVYNQFCSMVTLWERHGAWSFLK